jgi:hypothetical protein
VGLPRPLSNERRAVLGLPPKRGRGRPPGSKNRGAAKATAVDPESLVSRQLAMLDTVQRALADDLAKAMAGGERWVDLKFVTLLEKHAGSIARTIDTMRKSADVAEEMARRMTPEQLLEAAIAKLASQDLPTLRYAIKRLRAHKERLEAETPVPRTANEVTSATGAIAELDDGEAVSLRDDEEE